MAETEKEKSEEECQEGGRRYWFVCECIRDFWRSPVGRHLVNARRELLLACRTCIDRKIERLEKLLEDEEPKKIPVE